MRFVRLLVLFALFLAPATPALAQCCGADDPKPSQPVPAEVASFADVLGMLNRKAPEADLLKAIRLSPARFVLSVAQVDELKKAGASSASSTTCT